MSTAVKQYDLAIIGAGTAGLTAATTARSLGAKTAMIEGKRVGGECTWTGCVPSKALLAATRVIHTARNAERYGVHVGEVQPDFAAVMRYVHESIHTIYHEETPEALRKQGLDIYEIYAQFTDPHTLLLADGTSIYAKHILICTGATPKIPEPLRSVPHLTPETLFDLQTQPQHLLIIGGGPVGTEMAQAFRRLGSAVTVISRTPRLLPRDDAEASALLMDHLRAEGVTLKLGAEPTHAQYDLGTYTLTLNDGTTVQGDQVLVAVGKQPNLSSLNVEAAGVAVQDGKLVLDDYLRTSQRHIFAAGDVTGGPLFTHYAGWQAFQGVRNALLPLASKGVRPTVPWATFTDPEVAQAGLTEAKAREQEKAVQVTRLPMTRADRAVTEGHAEGFMKLIHRPNGRLLGATIVGYNAGEMINDWAAIIEKGGNVSDTSTVMRVYPTLGTANVILAIAQFQKQLDSGFLGRALRLVSRLTR